MDKTIYVIGHKNPDTDSVVSAVAYAKLKNLMGFPEYQAARAGHLNPQTTYIFEKFGLQRPHYVPDLIPKVEYFMPKGCQTVRDNISIWEAIGLMKKKSLRVLPVVDADGKYISMLHYTGFANGVLKFMNPEKHNFISTSLTLIQKTLNAQVLVQTFDSDSIFKGHVLVASSSTQKFENTLKSHASEELIVIASDREDIHSLCISHKVKVLIITSGFALKKEVREEAEKNGVSVLISPYSTSPTSELISFAMPVSVIGDKEIKPVFVNDTVSKIKEILFNSQIKYLPVIDTENKIVGIISEHDLLREPNVEVCLVDHNEPSQAVEGLDHYKILEIIDHHRLGNLSTKYPITFINKPVGSTATLITGLYREAKIPIPKEIASLLLCGILSDTLILKSATVTQIDIDTAEYLSDIADLDIQSLGNEIILAGSRIGNRDAGELVRQDMKEYTEGKAVYTVSQIEVGSTKEILDRKEEFFRELEIERRSRKGLFSCLLVTDITTLSSILLIECDDKFTTFINWPKQEEHIYFLQGVVSRKKQLVPLITEVVLNYLK